MEQTIWFMSGIEIACLCSMLPERLNAVNIVGCKSIVNFCHISDISIWLSFSERVLTLSNKLTNGGYHLPKFSVSF